MKGCQLLPGAQQATEHSSRVRIPYAHYTHTLSSIEQLPTWQENTTACLNYVPAFYRKSEERAQWNGQNLHDWKEKHVSVPHLNAAGDELQENVVWCVKTEGVADEYMAIYSRVNRVVPIMQPPKKEAPW